MFPMEQFFGGFGGSGLTIQLRCYSMAFFSKADAQRINDMNYGGNILLPNSVLDNLTRLNVSYPLLFKITNLSPEHQRVTHAGVLEFLAEEGKCYLPSWMMEQLSLVEGQMSQIQSTTLPMATYAKFKPMSADFLDISNPRAILEVELRKFRCLTKNDTLTISYNGQILAFKVMDLKPKNAVSITECDVNLEFDAPEGYIEPKYKHKDQQNGGTNAPTQITEMPEAPSVVPVVKQQANHWAAFTSEGNRLDGKKSRLTSTSSQSGTVGTTPSANVASAIVSSGQLSAAAQAAIARAETSANISNNSIVPGAFLIAPDENYEPGTLRFVRYNYRNRHALERDEKLKQSDQSKPAIFGGAGQNIRGHRY